MKTFICLYEGYGRKMCEDKGILVVKAENEEEVKELIMKFRLESEYESELKRIGSKEKLWKQVNNEDEDCYYIKEFVDDGKSVQYFNIMSVDGE